MLVYTQETGPLLRYDEDAQRERDTTESTPSARPKRSVGSRGLREHADVQRDRDTIKAVTNQAGYRGVKEAK